MPTAPNTGPYLPPRRAPFDKARMSILPLDRATLGQLTPPLAPAYDPRALSAGIVHLGVGNFHRAHLARYLHELFEIAPEAREWGLLGAALRAEDAPRHAALLAQDRLYTLTERDQAGESVRVIASLAGLIFAPPDAAPLLAALTDPAIRLVTLTITEPGYCLAPATKRLDPDQPAIRADLAAPDAPRSAIGVLVAALARRRSRGLPPFTVLSCDNIQANGPVLHRVLADFAALRAPGLADWITAELACPASMVDRITPGAPPTHRAWLAGAYGLDDACPVLAEPFSQFVIEEQFPLGRPALERVGVQFVGSVLPYEKMKLRLLNASHLALAALADLAGSTTIAASMRLPGMAPYLRRLMADELAPTLDPLPGIDLADYQNSVCARFANPAIPDTIARVTSDAPVNMLLDPIRDRLAADAPIPLLALALAAWLRRAAGRDDHGRPLNLLHPLAAILRAAIADATDPEPALAITPLFGAAGRDPRLFEAVRAWLGPLRAQGATACLTLTRPIL